MARAPEFTQEIADKICQRIASGESLRTICKDAASPSSSVIYQWLRTNAVFAKQYAHAREDQADCLAEEMLDVARTSPERIENGGVDSGDVAHRRLQIDVLKWRAGKLRPKVYGDKQEIEHSGSIDLGSALNAARDRAKKR